MNSQVSLEIKKNQIANDTPYKAYSSTNRQSSIESNPDQHQQEFVIRKLKQNADSRTKLRIGEQETKADLLKEDLPSNNNRS